MAEKFLSEVLGTMILILLGDGVVAGVLLAKTKANMTTGVGGSNGWIVITFAWAFAVFSGIAVAGQFSGAHINPAVSLAVFLDSAVNGGKFGVDSLLVYWAGQFVGAMIGAFLVFLHYYPHWVETEDKGLKLAVFCTAPAIRNPLWNLVSEIVGTFALVFIGFSLAGGAPAIGGALAWAFLVLVIGLSLGPTTGYAINPARDLGPRIMHAILPIPGKGGSDWEYAWIPVVGPLVGGALGWVAFNYLITNYVAKILG
ncbi:MAG: aquaporin family protein [Chloroflexi bacterium]|nr:aquaporin family protein [Chloroflexota bacterium]